MLPDDWKETLKDCDFQLAAEMLRDNVARWNRDAEAEGKTLYFEPKYAAALRGFAAQPCYDTAVKFLEISQMRLIRFGGHLPKGGYDVDHGGHEGETGTSQLHGGV